MDSERINPDEQSAALVTAEKKLADVAAELAATEQAIAVIEHKTKVAKELLVEREEVYQEVLSAITAPSSTLRMIHTQITGKLSTDAEYCSLPSGWEQRKTDTGRTYYVDHNTMSTHWKRPVPEEAQSGPAW